MENMNLLINNDSVDQAISKCYKNPHYIIIIAVTRQIYNNYLEYLKQKLPISSSRFTKYETRCVFDNGSELMLKLADQILGYRAHEIYYEENLDQELINCVLYPCCASLSYDKEWLKMFDKN